MRVEWEIQAGNKVEKALLVWLVTRWELEGNTIVQLQAPVRTAAAAGGIQEDVIIITSHKVPATTRISCSIYSQSGLGDNQWLSRISDLSGHLSQIHCLNLHPDLNWQAASEPQWHPHLKQHLWGAASDPLLHRNQIQNLHLRSRSSFRVDVQQCGW